MSKTTNRDSSSAEAGSVDQRLARLLDSPLLERVVPHLPPETLHQLIRHRGLDACADLLTAATPAQLASLVDLDLWSHQQPGEDEQFDVDRFGEWLDALVDTGASAAARIVASLDPQVVVAGLSRYVRPFDPGTFEPTASTDDEPMDRHEMMSSETSTDVLEAEIGGYLVRSRRDDAWDAIVALLVTLDAEHNDCFHSLMQGCRLLSNSRPEVDGLDDLLTTQSQQLHDVAVEREQRQSHRGYATPADARAFLQMARRPRAPGASTSAPNVIAAAYFRAADEEIEQQMTAGADAGQTPPRDNDAELPHSVGAVVELLTEAGMMPERPRALLEAGEEDPQSTRVPVLRRLMKVLLVHDEAAYIARSRELAFLANTLRAGCSVQTRLFTPEEAADAAACVCNLGLESGSAALPEMFLVDHDLVAAFEAGWSLLYHDVSVIATDQLISVIDHLRCRDPEIVRGLRTLKRQLLKQRDAGTPWLARDAADVLATLDPTAWIGVLGLLDECPIVPAALTAIVQRQTTPISPTAFEFVATAAQLADVRTFMKMLPALLSS
jgi:hypothetical protein